MTLKEDKVPVGEFFTGEAHAGKYQSDNWIARKLVRDFHGEYPVHGAGGWQSGCA